MDGQTKVDCGPNYGKCPKKILGIQQTYNVWMLITAVLFFFIGQKATKGGYGLNISR